MDGVGRVGVLANSHTNNSNDDCEHHQSLGDIDGLIQNWHRQQVPAQPASNSTQSSADVRGRGAYEKTTDAFEATKLKETGSMPRERYHVYVPRKLSKFSPRQHNKKRFGSRNLSARTLTGASSRPFNSRAPLSQQVWRRR